ncbi:hypothetical protein A2999_02460 [Candidatus Wolfebacteria bacterium RIFCSPLOWO2_01_FULL_38_11]|uniref:ROK family protein n=1 Tax=Candidatus Wolfebacteria bacterium RIFCSPLOWO2_01_FULL_38_11 TaxID=1802556 RepID=A0A1F8DPH4_9BACT|nr:MAG: hypothetical protein A2999_02460 [Candidatus Wolfebacteria bacterium RIFCSPLOWO2_01_FULL_38_11]
MYKLGIDVGGTKIKAILLDNKSKPHFAFNIATPKNKKAFLKNLESEIKNIIQKYKISGIGVGLPGIIDMKHGILIKSPNLPFLNNWQARKLFSRFSKNIAIDNDSRCFLRAEATLDVGHRYKNIVALTIGTGIGGGIMIDKKIYCGKNFSTGEFGHMIIDGKKTFEKLGARKTVLNLKKRNEIIGISVANLINAFNPEIVILGGGGIFSGDIKIKSVKKTASKFIMSPLAKNTPVVKGKLGENSQAIGAALLLK